MAAAYVRAYRFRQVTDNAFPGEEFPFVMIIACPLCTNPNDVLSQPSSISWKQVSCFSCDANLVLVREALLGTPRRRLKSGIRLKCALPGARQITAFLRSRLFILVATVCVFAVFGYLSWEAGFFENCVPIESSEPPVVAPPSPSSGLSPTAVQPPRSTADGLATK